MRNEIFELTIDKLDAVVGADDAPPPRWLTIQNAQLKAFNLSLDVTAAAANNNGTSSTSPSTTTSDPRPIGIHRGST